MLWIILVLEGLPWRCRIPQHGRKKKREISVIATTTTPLPAITTPTLGEEERDAQAV